MTDPGAGYNDPAPLPDPAFADAPPPGPSRSGSKSSKKHGFFVYMLPLGTGQFLQKRPLVGSFFLLSEIGAATYAFISYNDSLDYGKKAQGYKNAKCPGNTPCDPDDIRIINEYNDLADESNKYMIIGASAVGVLVFAGGIEALIRARSPSSSSSKKKSPRRKKRSSSRKYRGFTLIPGSTLYADDDDDDDRYGDDPMDASPWMPSLNVRLRPQYLSVGSRRDSSRLLGRQTTLSPAIVMDATWEF
jgi:hypothetical protein